MYGQFGKLGAIFLRVTFVASILLIQARIPAEAADEKFANCQEFASSSVPKDILWKVLARNGKSKTYTQIFALDGGTVGIANFAVGSLASLYRLMDTQKYFGRTKEDMIEYFSDKCRPGNHSGNDTGWGCYSKKWWRDGMTAFVNSPESESVQDQAWLAQMKPTVDLALGHGWTSARSLAIATGVANSVGGGGFNSLAAKHGWDPEKVLVAYAGNNAHRKRRRAAIDSAFPG